MPLKVYLQSLGCPKNLVDSEIMTGLLARAGMEMVLDPAAADVCVVNTCGFIGPAKRESIDAILELATYKRCDPHKRLVVTGCLAQRYGQSLAELLPEVDAFLGTGDFDRLPAVVAGRETSDPARYGRPAHLLPDERLPRTRFGPFFSAYLKVSEGCDHRCSFCAIPAIRGRHQSRPLASVLAEAQALAAEGVVELNLVAQDLTAYGRDLRDGTSLALLLRELAQIDGLQWIRLLYAHPAHLTREILEQIAAGGKICPYLDLPLQHVSDRVLRAMRRERSGEAVRRLVREIRTALPHVALRTAFLVGFPGETEEDFRELCDFVREGHFDHVGVFAYSPEEGTAAEKLPGRVPAAVARKRRRALLEIQAAVARARNESRVGSTAPVLDCGTDERGRWYGRLPTQAPEVDGVVYLSPAAQPGTIRLARIVRATSYDLYAQLDEAVAHIEAASRCKHQQAATEPIA